MKRDDYRIDFDEIRQVDSDPSNVYWHVVDRIFFMDWPSPEAELKKALETAPEGVRRFYLTGTILGPVQNGGFGSYFGSQRPRGFTNWRKRQSSNSGVHKL